MDRITLMPKANLDYSFANTAKSRITRLIGIFKHILGSLYSGGLIREGILCSGLRI